MRRTYDLLRTILRPLRPRARGRRLAAFVLISIVVASIAWSARRYELPVQLPIQLPVQLPIEWPVRLPALDFAALVSPAATHVAPQPAVLPVDRLIERAERVGRLWREVERYYELEIAPIERVLMRYRADSELARRVALSLVIEAHAVGLEPRLLLAVLLVENPWLDPTVRSPAGAIGLMQVMPHHIGKWPPCPPDLEDVEANICHGARIFAHAFRETGGDIERALLRYNGCVRGTNTPDCHTYPYHVYARAGRASILAWLRPHAEDAVE